MCSVCETRVTDEMVEAAKNFDKQERLEHLRTHDGAAAGVLPMFEDIDWDNIVFCVLHLYLRCTGKLIERLVLPLIDTEEVAKRVVDLLSKHSVRFNHVSASKEEANKKAHYDNFANHSWIGRDCDTLFLHIDEIFDILFEGKDDQSKREVYLGVFDSFFEAYQALTHIDDSQEREPQVVQIVKLEKKQAASSSANIDFQSAVAAMNDYNNKHSVGAAGSCNILVREQTFRLDVHALARLRKLAAATQQVEVCPRTNATHRVVTTLVACHDQHQRRGPR